MRRVYRNSAIAIAAFVVLVFALYPLLLDRLERAMISTGPNGPETPATVGLAYERLKIPSGNRLLDAYLVEADSSCRPRADLPDLPVLVHVVSVCAGSTLQATPRGVTCKTRGEDDSLLSFPVGLLHPLQQGGPIAAVESRLLASSAGQ